MFCKNTLLPYENKKFLTGHSLSVSGFKDPAFGGSGSIYILIQKLALSKGFKDPAF